MASKIAGLAVTKAQRERNALRATVESCDVDGDTLTYIEDYKSRSAKVVDRNGQTLARFTF